MKKLSLLGSISAGLLAAGCDADVQKCVGGSIANGEGICVCPEGQTWLPGSGRCQENADGGNDGLYTGERPQAPMDAATAEPSWDAASPHPSDASVPFTGADAKLPESTLEGTRTTAVRGDFSGDGLSDIALLGAVTAYTVPLAYAVGDGNWNVSNEAITDFATWAKGTGAKAIPGDYNGDGREDIALLGTADAYTIPVAFSIGAGKFSVTNSTVADFPAWAQLAGVKTAPGDFNKDGFTDLALTGDADSYTIAIAYSLGNGQFNVVNEPVHDFPQWAKIAGAQAIPGDFDGNGFGDLALVGATATTIAVAYRASSNPGTWNITNQPVASFPAWARVAGNRALAGDFNGDGRDDIALLGASGASTIAIAFSAGAPGSGTFSVTNVSVADFPAWAAEAGAQFVAGRFNDDERTDIALTGHPGAWSIPVAFSNGSGGFTVTNNTVPSFPNWASEQGAHAVGAPY